MGPTLGWPKKHKNLKLKNVPLSCGYMDQVEKKSLKDFIEIFTFTFVGIGALYFLRLWCARRQQRKLQSLRDPLQDVQVDHHPICHDVIWHDIICHYVICHDVLISSYLMFSYVMLSYVIISYAMLSYVMTPYVTASYDMTT